MTRRIGIAQALINDPDFLILDEPTSGLDPIGTRQVKDLLLEMRRRGKTILLSSHLLADVEDVCDRMVMLYGGRVRAQGTSEELLTDSQRTVIRTPRLEPALIESIREVLRSHGRDILDVEQPRQRLEQLFLDIVEQARREEVETSGATHDGQTAAFLRGEGAEGEQLIETLLSAEEPRERAVERAKAAPAERPAEEQKADVLQELLREEPESRSEPAAAADADQRPGDAPEVDQSLIQSLLSDEEQSDGEGEEHDEGRRGRRDQAE
jgi:ABC-2 type transport system ATP-binding protein